MGILDGEEMENSMMGNDVLFIETVFAGKTFELHELTFVSKAHPDQFFKLKIDFLV